MYLFSSKLYFLCIKYLHSAMLAKLLSTQLFRTSQDMFEIFSKSIEEGFVLHFHFELVVGLYISSLQQDIFNKKTDIAQQIFLSHCLR